MKHFILFILFTCFLSVSKAQKIEVLTSGTKTSLRGLSVVNDNIIWASGSDGQVAKSIDGGRNFQWITVTGYEQRDFRDIEAFDENTALILAVAEPAIILKTKDGGKTWKEVFHNATKGMFLDAMDFVDDGNGIVVGDPINNKLFIATTGNYGDKWRPLKTEENPYTAMEGEAFFAASGSNVKVIANNKQASIFFVTGGKKSRLFFMGSPVDLNIIQGKDSQGANSIAVGPTMNKFVVAGGDFSNDTATKNNIQIFTVNNEQILSPTVQTPPHGYRSCVSFITKDRLICCGTTGIDISNDGGLNWQLISTESYNVCMKAKKGNTVFLAGKDGRVSKLTE
jgi:hypothetical protein